HEQQWRTGQCRRVRPDSEGFGGDEQGGHRPRDNEGDPRSAPHWGRVSPQRLRSPKDEGEQGGKRLQAPERELRVLHARFDGEYPDAADTERDDGRPHDPGGEYAQDHHGPRGEAHPRYDRGTPHVRRDQRGKGHYRGEGSEQEKADERSGPHHRLTIVKARKCSRAGGGSGAAEKMKTDSGSSSLPASHAASAAAAPAVGAASAATTMPRGASRGGAGSPGAAWASTVSTAGNPPVTCPPGVRSRSVVSGAVRFAAAAARMSTAASVSWARPGRSTRSKWVVRPGSS